MAKTFACPHCEASYRALPTLVGRKVRCSSCRNVFQLQHTGIAIKVEVAAKKKSSAAAPAKPTQPAQQSPSKQVAAKSSESQSDKKPSRPQTRAIRKKQERIEEMRKSLSGLAAAADEGTVDAKSNALEARPSSKSSAKVKSASGKQGAASSGKLNKKSAGKKSLRDSHYVQLNHAGEREHKLRRRWAFLILGLVLLAFIVFTVVSSRSPVEQALREFIAPLEHSSERNISRVMAYCERMWMPYRLYAGDIPVILNIDEAQITEIEVFDWPQVISFMHNTIGKKKIHERFPFWVDEEFNAQINTLWSEYDDKVSLAPFYKLLELKKIPIIKFDELPHKMAASGMPKWLVYSLSLLLTPSAGDKLQGRIFGDNFPLQVKMCQFKGVDGTQLTEQNGYVDVIILPQYCGILLGFEGLEHVAQSEWRILDVRPGTGLADYYLNNKNPLQIYAGLMESEIRRQAILEKSLQLEVEAADSTAADLN